MLTQVGLAVAGTRLVVGALVMLDGDGAFIESVGVGALMESVGAGALVGIGSFVELARDGAWGDSGGSDEGMTPDPKWVGGGDDVDGKAIGFVVELGAFIGTRGHTALCGSVSMV